MKAFCFTLTILCAVQSILAYPRPEFAINGAVSGSDKVKTAATELNAAATKVGAGTFTPVSGYSKLATISNTLQAIGDAIVDAGTQLGTALNSLAGDGSNSITTVYDGVNAKLDALDTLLKGTFDGKLTTLESDTGAYIKKQFKDSFAATTATLALLKSALATLKQNVEKARQAAGSSPSVSAAIIRMYVPSKSVNAVLTEIRNLKSNMPLIQFVIDSSLENLKMVDSFVVDMKKEIDDNSGRYTTSYDGFKINLNQETKNYGDRLTAGVGDSVTNIVSSISSKLQENAKFTSDLSTPLTNLNEAVTTKVGTAKTSIGTAFTAYGTKLQTVFADLPASLGASLCTAVKSVSVVQIANGPYSDFCFSKYSPRVFAQVSLTIDAFDVCFEKEVTRLINVETSISQLAVQISYNTADLLDNLNVCLSLPTVETKGACFAMLAPYYTALVGKTEAHLGSVVKLLEEEAKSSYNRVGACLYTSLAVTSLTAADIATTANSCQTDGPQSA